MQTSRAVMTAIVIALVGVVGLVEVRPAAACSKRHQTMFELYDLAADVAVVRVGRIPRARYAGPVRLRVTRRLKGGRGATLVARENNTSCATGFRGGRTALVFVGADREPVGASEGYQEAPSDRTLAALTAWAAATTTAERAAVLVGAITGDDGGLAVDGAFYLADHPDLIAALTPAHTAALVAARLDRQGDELRWLVLARQHGPAWRERAAAGRLPRGPLTALAAHDYEAIVDTGALADIIATTRGEAAPARIAAFERCERVHGRALTEISSYGGGHAEAWWQKLAEACRTGAAPTW